MSLKKRPTGGEQPSALGALKLRVPFVHSKIEIPDILQGAILCVVPLSITALMTSVLGIPFEIRLPLYCSITYFIWCTRILVIPLLLAGLPLGFLCI